MDSPPSTFRRAATVIWRGLASLFFQITLSNEFYKCNKSDFSSAVVELIITTIFASMPIWLFPLIGPLIFTTDKSPSLIALSYLTEGELIVYASALVGPLLVIITRKYGEIETEKSKFRLAIAFPHGIMFIILAAGICVIGGFAIGLIRNPIFGAETKEKVLNTDGIFWLSTGLYFLSLYIYFCASVYRNAMESESKAVPENNEEDRFAKKWRDRPNAE